MKDLDYSEISKEVINGVKKGAFLTVRAGEECNTMTIGWGTLGFVWQSPVMMIAVRDSRHTYRIIEKSADFTVTIPSEDMKDQILFCGTKSGRDVNKFEECELKLEEGREVESPVIKVKGIHLECKIIFKSPMDPEYLDNEYEKFYPEKDFHTLYFGKIVACYRS